MNTADMLIELGYEVVEARSAEEALDILEGEAHIDGLITDQLMPGMTGVDLAKAVRTRRPGTPVLLVSGFARRTVSRWGCLSSPNRSGNRIWPPSCGKLPSRLKANPSDKAAVFGIARKTPRTPAMAATISRTLGPWTAWSEW